MHKIIAALFAIAGIYLPTFAVAQVPIQTLRTCLEIEDQSKERLDCYDEKIAPEPKQVSAPAKTVQDCRFVKEARAILWPRRPTSNAKLLPLGHRRSPSLPEPPRLGPGISLESASPDALQSADPRIRTIIALR